MDCMVRDLVVRAEVIRYRSKRLAGADGRTITAPRTSAENISPHFTRCPRSPGCLLALLHGNFGTMSLTMRFSLFSKTGRWTLLSGAAEQARTAVVRQPGSVSWPSGRKWHLILDRDIIRPSAEAGIWGSIRHHGLVANAVIVSDDADSFGSALMRSAGFTQNGCCTS